MRGIVPQLPHALLREIYIKLTLQKVIIIIIIIIIIFIVVIKTGNVPISM